MATVAAIEYFTATVPNVNFVPSKNEALPFYISSVGYQNGPAGDH